MRYLTQTIIVLVVFSLATASPAPAQTSSEGKIRTFTISGKAVVPGVTMNGLPGDPVTDERGYYSATVEYGWAGTVTPTKEGYSFEPAVKAYTRIISDRTFENYAAKIITYAISGKVEIPGVEMQGLPRNPVTDERGYYTSTIDYGWAGTVKPVREGYTFNPPRRNYSKVIVNLTNQNYTSERLQRKDWQFVNGRWVPMLGRTGRRKVLVVPAAEVKAEDLAEITEDMQVMSHILDERFKETRRIQDAFTDFGDFFGRDNRQTEATYLQGYGVLFSMEVNFAFSPPPKPLGQELDQTAERVDSTWQRARRQVFSSGDPRGLRGSDLAEEYHSRMVEELIRDLITTLKHAANVRGVQPDELVILTVIGGGRQSGGGFGGGGFMMGSGMSSGMMGGGYSVSSGSGGGGMMGGMGGSRGGFSGSGFGGSMVEMGVSSASVLTIRAKKSDIDAYAKGELILVQFEQKVQIFTY